MISPFLNHIYIIKYKNKHSIFHFQDANYKRNLFPYMSQLSDQIFQVRQNHRATETTGLQFITLGREGWSCETNLVGIMGWRYSMTQFSAYKPPAKAVHINLRWTCKSTIQPVNRVTVRETCFCITLILQSSFYKSVILREPLGLSRCHYCKHLSRQDTIKGFLAHSVKNAAFI